MEINKQNLGKVSVTVDKDYWDINKDYDRLTVVERKNTNITYLSRKPVPKGTAITNREFWIPYSNSNQTINSVDGEDLDSYNDVIKFKDKSYNPANYSGFGRKYLRKNIIDDNNVLTEAMLNDENTIYIIQYDYNLNNQTITIPEDSIIQFDGGSLKNGTIQCQQTTFVGTVRLNNVIIQGSITNTKIDVAWYDIGSAESDAADNDTTLSQYLLPSCSNTGRELVVSRTVAISSPITVSNFDLTCLKPFVWYGDADLNGAVITLSGTRRRHRVQVYNAITTGTFDVRKEYGIIGVDCNNINNSTIDVEYVNEFTTGLRISATNGGNAYNIYNINNVSNAYRNLVIYRTTGTWVNEDIINGGRYNIFSSSVWWDSVNGRGKNTAISFDKGSATPGASSDHIFNNLIFNKPCVEQAGVGIYTNSVVEDSSIIDIRNEGCPTLIQEDSSTAKVYDFYKCVVIPYRYTTNIGSAIYRTFQVSVKDKFKYTTYPFDLRALLYRAGTSPQDNLGVCFSNILGFYKSGNDKLGWTQSILAETPVTSDYIKPANNYWLGFIFDRNSKSFIDGTMNISRGSMANNPGLRATIVLLDENYACLTTTDLQNVEYSRDLALTEFSSGTDYRYFTAQVSGFRGNFSIANIPSKAKYIVVAVKNVNNGGLSGATLTINNELMLHKYPTWQFKVSAPVTGVFNMPSTTIAYYNSDNKLCSLRKENNQYVSRVVEKASGTLTEANALITDGKIGVYDAGYRFYATNLSKDLYLKVYTSSEAIFQSGDVDHSTTIYAVNPLEEGKAYRGSGSASAIKMYFCTTNDDTGDTLTITAGTDFIAPSSSVYPYIKVENTDTRYSRYVKIYPKLIKWVDDNGFTPAISRGITANRPTDTLTTEDAGYPYYDTDIHKVIYLKVESDTKSWIDAVGIDIT